MGPAFDTSVPMLHSDAPQSTYKANMASLLTALQDGGDQLFTDEVKAKSI